MFLLSKGDFELLKIFAAHNASLRRVNANGENFEEVLQEIHRLSLRQALTLEPSHIVSVS